MAGIEAVNQVGEAIVGFLNGRRALLAAAGRLGALPSAAEITHSSVGRIASGAEPTAGLTLMLYRLVPSDHQWPQPSGPRQVRPAVLSLDLLYLLTAWSGNPAEEQALMTWAMLELHRFPTLDRTVLGGGNDWAEGEALQIAHEALLDDDLFRLWQGMQRKYRLSTAFRARILRVRAAPDENLPPVVEKRLGFMASAGAEAVP